MELFKVKYYAGTYNGTIDVLADDEESAIAKVRALVRREMTLAMYADGYKIVKQTKQKSWHE